MIRRKTLIAAAVLLVAAPAAAQDDAAPAKTAWEVLFAQTEDQLTFFQQEHLLFIAWHMAAGTMCDDPRLVVDRAAMASSLDLLEPEQDMDDEEHAYHEASMLTFIGMATGIMVAEAVEDVERFCDDAADVLLDEEFLHLFDDEPLPEAE